MDKKTEALKLALEALEGLWKDGFEGYPAFLHENAITAIKEALAQPEQEPVKVSHKHEWFRTGTMKVGQMRCISCGIWGQDEIPQRPSRSDMTWVGLTPEEVKDIQTNMVYRNQAFRKVIEAIEAKLKEKNNG